MTNVSFLGNLQLAFGRVQKDPITLYNSKSRKAFVTWQEAGVVLSYHVEQARRPLCDPPCLLQQTCALQDTCVSLSGGEYIFVPRAFVFSVK